MRRWQLQEAKARLSELVKSAQNEGPQQITLRGDPVVVVLSRRDYERLAHEKPSFVELFRRSPLSGIELNLDRDRSAAREVDL